MSHVWRASWSEGQTLNGQQETGPLVTHHRSPLTIAAFTLIELMVVIAVIAILAALIFPVTATVNRAKIRNRARAELQQVATAIENYKAKLGHYPPDNTNTSTPYLNQLYYELVGTTLDNNNYYTTLDSSSKISASVVPNLFGVSGFVNASKGGGGDEGPIVVNFFPKGGLK